MSLNYYQYTMCLIECNVQNYLLRINHVIYITWTNRMSIAELWDKSYRISQIHTDA